MLFFSLLPIVAAAETYYNLVMVDSNSTECGPSLMYGYYKGINYLTLDIRNTWFVPRMYLNSNNVLVDEFNQSIQFGGSWAIYLGPLRDDIPSSAQATLNEDGFVVYKGSPDFALDGAFGSSFQVYNSGGFLNKVHFMAIEGRAHSVTAQTHSTTEIICVPTTTSRRNATTTVPPSTSTPGSCRIHANA